MWPSGANATAVTPEWHCRGLNVDGRLVATSQIRTVPSLDPDTTHLESGENFTEERPDCPRSGSPAEVPVCAYQRRTVLSSEADAIMDPFGAIATEYTLPSCPSNGGNFESPVPASQIRTEWSSDPDTTAELLVKTATEFTGPVWAGSGRVPYSSWMPCREWLMPRTSTVTRPAHCGKKVR